MIFFPGSITRVDAARQCTERETKTETETEREREREREREGGGGEREKRTADMLLLVFPGRRSVVHFPAPVPRSRHARPSNNTVRH